MEDKWKELLLENNMKPPAEFTEAFLKERNISFPMFSSFYMKNVI